MQAFRFLLFLTFLFISVIVKAETLVVSEDIGFDPENSTNLLQFALDEATDTLIIDNVGQAWITGPLLVNNSNLTLIFEPGTVVNALEGAYGIFDPMFRIRDVQNIKIFGYGALIQMNKQEYIDLEDSEWRHAFNIQSVVNFRMEGLEIKDTGGDGIIIGKSFQPGSMQNYCENVIVRNCTFDNNYRQGLTISSVKNCIIENCVMKNTLGTLPEAGIDIEPDVPDEILQNVIIRNCQFINNNGNAIMLALSFLDDTSEDISITIEDCYFENNFTLTNIYAYAEIACLDNGGDGVDGFVNFERCYVSSSQFSAAYIRKSVDSYDVNFENCVFKNVSQNPIEFNNPIFFEVSNYDEPAPRTGGVNFTDCRVDYDGEMPFFTYFENLGTVDGLGDVTGNFFISNANSPGFETGTNPENVNITFEDITGAVSDGVEIEFLAPSYLENEDNSMSYNLSRDLAEVFPLAVDFTFSGEAEHGIDYALHQPSTIIEAGSLIANAPIDILDDDFIEGNETVIISLQESSCYSLSNNQAQTLIIDDNSLGVGDQWSSLGIDVFPNPARDQLQIQSDADIDRIEIFSQDGRKLRDILRPGQWIDLSTFSSGLYLFRLFTETGAETVKVIVH